MMEKLYRSGACCFAIVLANTNQVRDDGKQGEEVEEEKLQQLPTSVRRLIEEHKNILEPPNGLPPSRPFDHMIVL